ncbi:SusC/RagA family TonB-linked outer membrane protein [Pedobacter deserti]|uniref:SusC/RagA family TonB-linked outer membrane protein n=1 Tax=Pedobacter deserti TaxID=2817382 RepID=UPI00210DD0ED|nr:SusC/RagA family TonB-linked outer membrane protein [Pedobacter sp. SYSU D00382]
MYKKDTTHWGMLSAYARKIWLIMRLTTVILIVAIVQVSATGFAQKISLTRSNASLESVINELRVQSGYNFIATGDVLDKARLVSIDVRNKDFRLVLEQIFEKQPISYDIENNTVTLKTREASLLDNLISRFRSIDIRGRVTDDKGQPLPGVTILVKGTQRGTLTAADGSYQIKADDGEILVFSYLGFMEAELTVGRQNSYDLQMKPTSIELGTVELVSTGYQTLPKERATGSFERINQQTLDRKISQNVFSKIEGEVAGVTTDANGRFIIRGLSSIRANTDPLIVVDGFPVEQGANTINTTDVESIVVLKDASAASIWGIRAANGVIVITTKKAARNGKLNVSGSVNTAFTPKPDLFAVPLGDAATQVAYHRAMYEVGGYYLASQLYSGVLSGSSGRVLNPVGETLLLRDRGDITAEEAESRLQDLANTDIRKEYRDLIQQTEAWRQYNVSVSGGSKNYDFVTSASYNGNDKEFVTTGARQYLLNFANTFNPVSRLKIDGSLNFSQSKENFPASTTADGIPSVGVNTHTTFLNNVPLNGRILDESGNYVPMESILSFGKQSSDLALSRGFPYAWTYNIKQELENTNNTLRETALRLQTGATYNFMKGLDFSMKYQYEWAQQNTSDLHNEQTLFTRSRVNMFSKLTNGVVSGYNIDPGAILDTDLRNQRAHTFRSQLNFDRSFGDGKHQVVAIAGYEVRKTLFDRATDRKYGYNEQSLTSIRPDYRPTVTPAVSLTTITTVPPNTINEYIENRFISYYANGAYTYDNRYTVSASTRLDDTNLFGTSDKYKNIPLYSFGFKWNVYNEFLKGSEVVDDMQFRTTYGTNGNVDRSTSPFLQAKIKRGFPPFNGMSADIISVPNPELRLEKTRTLNVGADFSLFNRFISGSAEYYVKNSEDLLAFTTLNPTLGVTGALINNGTLRNEGFDLNLRFRVLENSQFSYYTTGIFSVNKNTLKKVDVPNKQIFEYVNGTVAESGAALRTIYSYQYKGLDAKGAPQFANELGQIVDVKTFINSTEALVKHGSLIPKFYGSWINSFSYRNVYMRALTTFKAGHVFRYARNNNVTYIPAVSVKAPWSNVTADFNQRWQNPGDEHFTDIPALPTLADRQQSTGYDYYRDADKFVDNASFIRLSQLNLGYSLGKKMTDRLGLTALQIGLQADNLAVWNFNKWDVDPESNFIPVTPTYTLNVSISF